MARTALAFAALALCMGAAQADAPSQRLRAAVDAAWQRASLGPALAARQSQVEAGERVLDSAFPRSPTVGFSYRRDLWTNQFGKRELEPELSLPLWAAGERDAVRAVAGAERGALAPAAAAARLRVAGQVREALWAFTQAQSELEAASRRLEALRALAADVERRERAGELPRTDLLQARAAVLEAQGAALQAQAAREGALHDWRALTGLDAPRAEPEPPSAAAIEAHPELREGASRVAVAMAQLAQAREVRRDGPELALTTRHDRDARGLAERDTIRVGIRIPLDTEARNAPRIAAAGTALADAESVLARERLRIEAARLRAQEVERAADAARALAGERLRVAVEGHELIEKAFRLGERSLAELLRARVQRDEAALEEMRASARFGLARARLNQSHGVLP